MERQPKHRGENGYNFNDSDFHGNYLLAMKRIKVPRNARGFSLTEMIVTAVLLGLSMAAIGEVCVMNTFATTKMSNKVDGLSAGRTAIERVARDIRMSRTFGDFYSNPADNDENQFPSKN